MDSGLAASRRPGMTRGEMPGRPLSCGRLLRVLNRLPDLLRRQWRRELGDAELGERIHHAVGDAGRAADRTRLAAALGTQRIGLAGRGAVERYFDRRNVFR